MTRLEIATRTTPAVPAWCHAHEVWECAAVSVDQDTKAPVGVCHRKTSSLRPWCATHQPNGLASGGVAM